MNDREKREDESLKKCIQEAYGCTDEQLMDELNEIEESLSDSDFPGVEDRILSRLMERMKETVPEALEDRNASVEDETAVAAELVNTVDETKKVVRIGKKKIFLVAALAAAFAGTVGVTAIGGKSYFFRKDEDAEEVIFDSGKNNAEVSSVEEAYKEIKNEIGDGIFKLGYLPEGVRLDSLSFDSGKAIVKLEYEEQYLYFIQWKRDEETSAAMKSNKENPLKVENEWLNQKICFYENIIDNDEYEYESQIETLNNVAWFFGIIEKSEFEKILKNIYFY